MSDIDKLIESGEEATKGEWESVLDAGDPDGQHHICRKVSKGIGTTFGAIRSREENRLFIIQAANAREAIKQMRDENKRLKVLVEVAYEEGYCSGAGTSQLLDEELIEAWDGSEARKALEGES